MHSGPGDSQQLFRPYVSIGVEEERAVGQVLQSGRLSDFLGAWDPRFYGGERVRLFESSCADYFSVRNAVAVNSWTSGLTTAVGALGLEPGDEVVVTPWTMSASVAAILHWNAIPVFADIDRDTYCLDPAAVEDAISPETRAIMSVDIFGQSANVKAINEVASRFGLSVISDTAQAPGAQVGKDFAGTLTTIGGFSFNYHKHVHTGEGGMIVTNDDELAERCRMIRNHAEAVIADRPGFDLTNMLGHNFRLGEIEAAIGLEQLRKLDRQVKSRIWAARELTDGLSGLAGLILPRVSPGNTHVYYNYAMQIDTDIVPWSRDQVAASLRRLGLPGISTRYQELHLLPMFQELRAYGRSGFPWVPGIQRRPVDYRRGIAPVAEDLNARSYLGFALCQFEMSPKDVEFLIEAFRRTWSAMGI